MVRERLPGSADSYINRVWEGLPGSADIYINRVREGLPGYADRGKGYQGPLTVGRVTRVR